MVDGIRKKAQEISFVLLRVAPYINRKELRARLESLSYQLIEDVYGARSQDALSKIDALSGLVALASNVRDINEGNADILLKELGVLNAAIRQNIEAINMPDIGKSFSKLELPNHEPIRQKNKAINPAILPKLDTSFLNVLKEFSEDKKKEIPEDGQDLSKALARQDSIIYKIRQLPGQRVQFKDIIAAFPDISERTLRYDLGKLCDNGRLTREGAGGPSNYYVIKALDTTL